MNDKTRAEVRLVCLGRRFARGKMAILFLEEGQRPEKAHQFKFSRRTRMYGVGGIYTVQMSDDRGSAWFDPDAWKHLVGTFDDEAQIAAWRVSDDAAVSAERLFKKNQKLGAVDTVLGVLEPIRLEYLKADGPNQRLIELAVLQYLRRP